MKLTRRQREIYDYLAEFIEGAGQVFRNVRESAVLQPAAPVPGEDYCAGLDLARVNDYTVLVVMDSKRRVVHWDRFTRVDWKTQVGRIATVTKKYSLGRTGQLVVVTFAWDNSYPTNGETVSITDVEYIHFMRTPRAGANEFTYDKANNKVIAYVATTGAEVANATDLSAQTATPFAAITG